MTQPMNMDSGEFETASRKAKEDGGGWTLVKVIVLVVLAVLVLFGGRAFLFQPFNIPSGSLVPTLLVGDYVFVSKFSYGYSHFSLPAILDRWPGAAGRLFAAEPKRGDVVVFKLPRDGQTDYIKRVIGLPGDKIQMVHGRLSINGALVERKLLAPYVMLDHFNRPIEAPHYAETLPGGARDEIIQLDGDDGYLANTPVFEVPPGNYFMMGDNRDNSLDSRSSPTQGGVGFVPFENLLGRAEIIFFSAGSDAQTGESDGGPWNLRWRRMFQPVK